MSGYGWTQDDFDAMSWHDNHVHGIQIQKGEHGTGELTLDMDYILEWLKDSDGGFAFRKLPVALTFHQVSDLQIKLDYVAASAAITPFCIHKIGREFVQKERYVAQLWTLEINWPVGEIRFEAVGYTQTGRGVPVVSAGQGLSAGERA